MQKKPLNTFELTTKLTELDRIKKEINENSGATIVGEWRSDYFLISREKLEKIISLQEDLWEHYLATIEQHEDDLEELDKRKDQEAQEALNVVVQQHLTELRIVETEANRAAQETINSIVEEEIKHD